MRRFLIWLVVLAMIGLGVWSFLPFFLPPTKQVERQQAIILTAAGRHDWKKVAAMVAEDYHDAAGLKKQGALDTAKELLDPFLSVKFEWTESSIEINGKQATLTGTLRMHAMGPSGGAMITDRVNEVREPWKFVWQKDGWNPDDWKLISVSNTEVENLPR